ncbi:MAG TPA: hypothetical protein VD833_11665 [Vicinamibacterales bacterium]|nr:hypothetical protein [Vicinamibacterales bacterium]
MIASGVLILTLGLVAQDPGPAACETWQDCRAAALEAAGRGDHERFHDLAWRAVQRGPRNDPALMTLLARAQSLSGRPGDAIVMLQRIADLGVLVVEAAESEDFRRVRALPGWPDLEARLTAAPAATSAAVSPVTPTAETPADPAPGPRERRAPSSPSPPGGTVASKPDANAAAAAPVARAAAAAPAGRAGGMAVSDALRFETSDLLPAGLAYDSVSNRFILGDRRESRLAVVGERSQRLSTLTGGQSAGFGRIAGFEIDRHEGDLWVISVSDDQGEASSVLHKLQLISGRQLFTISPEAEGPTQFTDVTLTPSSTVLVLDRAGRRLFRSPARGRELLVAAKLDIEDPASVAAASDTVAYVAHRDGLVRVDLGSRTSRPVAAVRGVDVKGLSWIRWARGGLVGVQRAPDGAAQIVRIAMDPAGTRARRLTVLDEGVPMPDPMAAALNGDVLYYLAGPSSDGDGRETVVRRIALK